MCGDVNHYISLTSFFLPLQFLRHDLGNLQKSVGSSLGFYEREARLMCTDLNHYISLTSFFVLDHFSSFAIISAIFGIASAAASAFKNARRVRLARKSTTVHAYSFTAYWISASMYGNCSTSRFPTTGQRLPVMLASLATSGALFPYV